MAARGGHARDTMIRMNAAVRACALAAGLLLTAAAPAAARDAVVNSFDGTPIHVTLHPAAGLQAGERAPTILQTHGWGGTRDRDPESATRAPGTSAWAHSAGRASTCSRGTRAASASPAVP